VNKSSKHLSRNTVKLAAEEDLALLETLDELERKRLVLLQELMAKINQPG